MKVFARVHSIPFSSIRVIGSTMSESKYVGLNDKIVFASEEEKTLNYWKEIDAFNKSLELSEGKPEYTFYDGPPFATGMPHYG